MKNSILYIVALILSACGATSKKTNSIELITDVGEQETVFQNLIMVTQTTVPTRLQTDSLAFLVLPVQASCPSCRNKTIDSIVSHENTLLKNHFIVISANGGRKTINGYFQENNKLLPLMLSNLVLDTTNMAYQLSLYDKKPVMYYTYNKKAYKKVAAIPQTIRNDLREFFSGYRNSN